MKCVNCPNHKVISDKDPHDWFNDDDEAIVCLKVPNPRIDLKSKYLADKSDFRVVACSLRPYETDKIDQPKWCPILVQ